MRVAQKLSLVVLLACYGSTLVFAQTAMQGYPRDDEIKMLPPLCLIKLRKEKSPEYQVAQETYGPDFMHVHHYCAGINFINRYYRATSSQDKRFVLQEAMGNLSYMVKHAQPDFVLMPDVYLQRGITYSLQKKTGEALADMQKAIELNPKQARSYSVLADLYEDLKLRDKALATVSEGLRHLPNSKLLQRRYDALGGKKPYPEPIAPEAAPETSEAKPKEDALSPAAIRAKREGDAQAPAASTEAGAAPAATPPTVIGTPRNPWCRYCAEDVPPPANPLPPSTPATAPTVAP